MSPISASPFPPRECHRPLVQHLIHRHKSLLSLEGRSQDAPAQHLDFAHLHRCPLSRGGQSLDAASPQNRIRADDALAVCSSVYVAKQPDWIARADLSCSTCFQIPILFSLLSDSGWNSVQSPGLAGTSRRKTAGLFPNPQLRRDVRSGYCRNTRIHLGYVQGTHR